MGTYVVGDIHGCLDEWLKLKNNIESQDHQAKFILVGDIVDRGPKVYETLQWAMRNVTPNGKYQMILGNHEDMKIDWLKAYFEVKEKNKDFTLYDMETDYYNFHFMCLDRNLSDQQLKEILNFFESLPIYKEIDISISEKRKKHYIIVHGGLGYQCLTQAETVRKNCLTEYNKSGELINVKAHKNREEMLWSRNTWGYELLSKSIIVHGHTPTFNRDEISAGAVPGMIHFINNSINVDCGLVFKNMIRNYGNLAAIRLEDLEEFYLYQVNYKENKQKKLKMLQRRKAEKPNKVETEEWKRLKACLD